MTDSIRHEEKPGKPKAPADQVKPRREESMDEEEKVLAGRTDVNMPALLTKDVKGG
jgi:hypothetical protein